MEKLTKVGKRVKVLAGILGFIQALAWIVLLSLALYYRYHGSIWKMNISSWMDEVETAIFLFFIHGDYFRYGGQIFHRDAFFKAAIVLLVVNSVWLLTSLYVLATQWNTRVVKISLKLWGCSTLIVCIADLVMTVLLGIDYDNCLDYVPYDYLPPYYYQPDESACANGILPVLVIAARGFVLWIVNIVLAVILIKMSLKLKPTPLFPKAINPPIQQGTSPVHAYQQPAQSNYAPFYSEPPDQYGWHTGQKVQQSPVVPMRQWEIHSAFPEDSPKYGKPDVFGQHVLSNQTQKPFVLDSPPRRY